VAKVRRRLRCCRFGVHSWAIFIALTYASPSVFQTVTAIAEVVMYKSCRP
jgi:hypothetical protein